MVKIEIEMLCKVTDSTNQNMRSYDEYDFDPIAFHHGRS